MKPLSESPVTDQKTNHLSGRSELLILSFLCSLLLGCSESSTPTNSTELNTQVQPVSESTLESTTEGTASSEESHTTHMIRFTDSNQDIWPPQPEDITEVAGIFDTSPSDTSAKINSTLKSNLEMLSTLGSRYEILAHQVVRDKTDNTDRIDMEIFDYDNNQVVTVKFDEDGRNIISHTVSDAHLYQPPESPAEVSRAIKLAAVDLSQQGFTEHTNLTGTGLLAFPTAVQTSTTGANFYSHRKIYVTFGTGNGELPHYRALVNLSTNSVESSGSIQ